MEGEFPEAEHSVDNCTTPDDVLGCPEKDTFNEAADTVFKHKVRVARCYINTHINTTTAIILIMQQPICQSTKFEM